MKRNKSIYIAGSMMLLLTSCNDFLSVIPDNSTDTDTAEKISSLLVSAYPQSSPAMITELASDNATDNGSEYTIYNQLQEDAYLWADVTYSNTDSPEAIWRDTYYAAACANQALQSIKELGDPASLNSQKGEALLCRAYAHFVLANVFCLAYDESTAGKTLGIPYSLEPETNVKPDYERGTLAEVYAKIEADIEAGLSLINDDSYSIPKYHFTHKAAYAFAARFYLYSHKLDKVIECANEVLGSDPKSLLRDWKAINAATSDPLIKMDMYISDNESANLLLQGVYSSWPLIVGPYDEGKRYGLSNKIFKWETTQSSYLWGDSLYELTTYGFLQKIVVPKIGYYKEYAYKVAQVGHIHSVVTAFTTDETLLCRAEAYALQSDYAHATQDINDWISTHSSGKRVAVQDTIIAKYSTMKAMDFNNPDLMSSRKTIHPQGFVVKDSSQEAMIDCILQLRKIETIHEGLRWYDIKRYGIEISHKRDGQSPDYLLVDDPRRAIQLPQSVISAGMTANPR